MTIQASHWGHHDLRGQFGGEFMTWQVKSLGKTIGKIAGATSPWVSRMKTIEERIGQRIARQRRAVGLTQAQLAEKINVQPETISRIETGSQAASLDLIAHLSEALELGLHELFRLQEVETPKDRAIERLLWFASRLSSSEIELVMDVGAAVLGHIRRAHEV